MSWQPCTDPSPGDKSACDLIDTLIVPRARDLGGFEVRRALPSTKRQMVGPFIFFDQMGPSEFVLGEGMDVRPHPHIGLSTITYLFRGAIVHRDSLGTEMTIEPGAVNLMTAGQGIVHSERTGREERKTGAKLFGLQTWVALPQHAEETLQDFEHTAADALPELNDGGKRVRLIAGSLYGESSPVTTAHETLYVDVALEPGARLPLPADHEERAIYTVEGDIEIAGDSFGPAQLLVFKPGDEITVTAKTAARFVIVGGAPMDGPRYIWWNFVSSSKERIEQAKEDWRQ
ncbi:MAG: pirin family protein, partial [Pseudomonadota bacterium]